MASGALGVGERINGVNLGNWLVLERWMKPGIFAASGEADEIWLHRATKSAELEALLTRHRDTYITEADFRNIAAHGCNLVRIPVPYFVFGDVPGHPGCTEYLDRAFDWAERTGLKILIDLHTVPGSQNGFDNGGLTGVVRWHRSPRAVAYALDVLVRLARWYRLFVRWNERRIRRAARYTPVIVGEWCVANGLVNRVVDKRTGDGGRSKENAMHSASIRGSIYREVAAMQRKAWNVSAGQIYWSYQLRGNRDFLPTIDPQSDTSRLDPWDLTHVWHAGWMV